MHILQSLPTAGRTRFPDLSRFSDIDLSRLKPVAVDFEFTRLPLPGERMADWLQRVQILSIGLAPSAAADPFYATAVLTSELTRASSEWTRDNVIPLLGQRRADATWRIESKLQFAVTGYLNKLQSVISRQLVIVADWPGDLLLFHRLMGSLTPHLALADVGIDQALEWEADPEAAREGLIRHNALDDAIWLRRVLGFEPESEPQESAAA